MLGTSLSSAQIAFRVALIVISNAVLTEALGSRRGPWRTTGRAFAGTVALNAGIVAVLRLVFSDDDDATFYRTAFIVLLLSLIITLYDRYRPRGRRVEAQAAPAPMLAS